MTDYRITESKWVHPATALCHLSGHSRPGGPPCKPVLVLDPDDAEQMRALYRAYLTAALVADKHDAHAMAAAVRSMLEPESEFPPEPGMDARVIAGGWQWAQSTTRFWWPLTPDISGAPEPRRWPDLCRDFGPVEIITPDGDA